MATAQSETPRSTRDLYPVAILEDRYGGGYSGGKWIAVACADEGFGLEPLSRVDWMLQNGPHGNDLDAAGFWSNPPTWVAVGSTPDGALEALAQRMNVRD
ncbi:hypothetical protein [Sphingomonas sp.]|uniref:hypothetical protein n=1 Tax=Sphingomonas sp. TaxID=28214 RepID=UPI001B1BCB46|nr:hypothetical protein [Sphingomonas sp.]MBO9715197.1 hypothetical protein [Sphingomonas sp.]